MIDWAKGFLAWLLLPVDPPWRSASEITKENFATLVASGGIFAGSGFIAANIKWGVHWNFSLISLFFILVVPTVLVAASLFVTALKSNNILNVSEWLYRAISLQIAFLVFACLFLRSLPDYALGFPEEPTVWQSIYLNFYFWVVLSVFLTTLVVMARMRWKRSDTADLILASAIHLGVSILFYTCAIRIEEWWWYENR